MSNSQNEKNEQQNNLCTTLTEQWKKGELESGVYYIKYRGACEIDHWHGWYWEDSWSEYVEEVVAPVPSYEEWQELIDKKHWCNARAKNLLEKNQQLKELLKECKHVIEWYKADYKGVDVLNEDVITKIDNAIGEKNNGN